MHTFQHAHSLCLWHACNILAHVAYVASVMQVSVACVQLECSLPGACIHCVCLQCMCSKLVAFLHVVCLCKHECVHLESVQPWQASGKYAVHVQHAEDRFVTCVWHVWCVQGECHKHAVCV